MIITAFFTSCTSGVDVSEANKVLSGFSIAWPAGFSFTCESNQSIDITINALDQNGELFNWSGSVTLSSSNENIAVTPSPVELSNGSVTRSIIFENSSEEDQITKLTITAGGVATTLEDSITVHVTLLDKFSIEWPGGFSGFIPSNAEFDVTITALDTDSTRIDTWDGTVGLAMDKSSVAISPTTVDLKNGTGQATLTFASSENTDSQLIVSAGKIATVFGPYTFEKVIAAVDITPVSGALIAGHETVVIQFNSSMKTDSLVTGGDIGSAGPASWSSSVYTNDTLTLDPSTIWTNGSGKVLSIDCKSENNTPIETISLNYAVFYGTCVTAGSKGNDISNSGTTEKPKKTIQAGIDAAYTLYITGQGLSSAEVRVAAGAYTVDWNGGTNRIIMKEGISVFGGYTDTDWKSRDIQGNVTTIEDTSSANGTAGNPNCTVNFPNTTPAITAATVLDGFTIRPGKGDYNAGIFSLSASGTISNVTVIGRTKDGGGGTVWGIKLDKGSPMVSGCTVFTTWEGNDSSTSYGINTLSDGNGNSPTIELSTISGGRGTLTYGIYSGSDAGTIQNNTIYAGYATTESDGIVCYWSGPTISYNSIGWGDVDNINVSSAYAIRLDLSTGLSYYPVINNNTFPYDEFSDPAPSGGTYAIYEADANSDPDAVSNNTFSDGYAAAGTTVGYYYEEGTTRISNLTTSITLQGTTSGTLASFGNSTF